MKQTLLVFLVVTSISWLQAVQRPESPDELEQLFQYWRVSCVKEGKQASEGWWLLTKNLYHALEAVHEEHSHRGISVRLAQVRALMEEKDAWAGDLLPYVSEEELVRLVVQR